MSIARRKKFSEKLEEFIRNNTQTVLIGSVCSIFIIGGLIYKAKDIYLQTQAAECTTTLQSLIDKATPGSTIVTSDCIFRESVRITKPLTLDGQGKTEIRGSDIWTGWTKIGNTWVSTKHVPQYDNDVMHCSTSGNGDPTKGNPKMIGACRLQEQVFIDGKELSQVTSNPLAGEFMINGDLQIVMGDTPTGRTVEVSVRQTWIQGGAANVTIKGFVMKHAANKAQVGALTNSGYANWTVENNKLSNTSGVNVTINNATGGKIINNEISYAGQLGIGGNRSPGLLIKGNKIHHNNNLGFSCGWECGALKVAHATDNILEDNESYENFGYGLWCDIECVNTTFRRNRVYDNANKGIVQEISGSAKIYDNRIWNNGFGYTVWGWGAGALSQNSDNVEMFNNILAWNADGMGVISQGSRSDNPSASNNSTHDNFIAQDKGYALFTLGDSLGANNTFTNNKVYLQGNASVEIQSGYSKITKTEIDTVLKQVGIPTQPGVKVTPSATITPVNTITLTPTNTVVPSLSKTPTPIVTTTFKPTLTVSPVNTVTPSISKTPSPSVSLTPSTTVTPTTSCPKKQQGDANCDNSVDLLDFRNFREEYILFANGKLTIEETTANFNDDDSLDLGDFSNFRQGYINQIHSTPTPL
jgi:hypothetical protein